MDRPVSIHTASPGVVLTSEVITASGQVVMPSGVTLTGELIEQLRRLGVYTLIIRREAQDLRFSAKR